MVAKTKIVNMEEVKTWMDEGRTYQWMVDEYLRKYDIQTNPSMWGNVRRRLALDRRTTQNDALIPWRLNEEHRGEYAVHLLRMEARRREGKELRPQDLAALTKWLEWLDHENLVLHYDPETKEGLFYIPREARDTDIIRAPQRATGKRQATPS
ncbi:hypothetical protein [Actinoplanes sp. NPDC049118]|uniref:hypothetical protein n=1 Tax=Actinoplanes sp. NPDC049118 TaxID=3155769 RepID=UPI0033E27E7A